MATNKLDKNTLTGIANGGGRSRFATSLDAFIDPAASDGRKLLQLGRAAVGIPFGAVANASSDLFNAVTRPPEIPASTRSMTRVGDRPTVAAAAPMTTPTVRGPKAFTAAPSPTLGMATTPSGYGQPIEQPRPTPALSSVPVVPGARRVATRPAATGQGVRTAPAAPQPQPRAEAASSQIPLIYENTDAVGLPAALQATLPPTPGERMYGADGTNGGYGFTTNPDGTIERMFTLRQRTAAEDAANPRVEGMAGGPNEVAPRLRPGSPGWAGSQDEWEWNQQFENMGPMSAKDAQDIRLRRLQTEDVYQDNQAKNETTAFGARSLAERYGVLNRKDETLTPIEAAAGVAGVRNTEARTRETAADTALKQLQAEFYPSLTKAQIEKMRTDGIASLMNANTAAKNAEQKTALKPEDTVAALLDQTYNKAAKEFSDLLTASPLMAAQYKTAEELQAAAHNHALQRVTRFAQLLDQSGVQ